MGYPWCSVQLCPLKASDISNKNGPRIKVAPLLPIPGWVQSQLVCVHDGQNVIFSIIYKSDPFTAVCFI